MAFMNMLRDLESGFAWALMDTKCKYRRSVIGPFWETINVFVMMMGMAYVSAAIFNGSPMNNMPYVGLGIIAWSAMSGLVSEGTSVFVQNRDYIRNSSLNLRLYVSRVIFRVMLVFAHHFVLYAIGLMFLSIPLGATNLLGLVGILALLVNAFWVVPVLGFLSARFRDLEMIIRNLLQLIFFVTPIFWTYENISPSRIMLIRLNPFFYFMDLIRTPLLGSVPPVQHYIIVGVITVLGFILLALVKRRFRRNLAFYV